MAGSLGSLVVSLAADIGMFESDMGKAARIAERESNRIAGTTRNIGRTIGDIGRAIGAVGVGGLEKLGEGARAATAAVKGLGAATMLIGVASWPVAAITAAAAALGYFISNSSEAAEAAEELSKRIDKLRLSKEQLAMLPFVEDSKATQKSIAETTAEILKLEKALNQSREEAERAAGRTGHYGKMMDTSAIAVQRFEKQLTAARENLVKLQGNYITLQDTINGKTGEFLRDANAPLEKYLASLKEQVATYGKGAEAAARYALEHGELSALVEKMGPAGKEAAEKVLEYARSLDKLNREKAEATQRERDHQQAMADNEKWYDAAQAAIEREDEAIKSLGDSIKRYINPAMYDYQQQLIKVSQALQDNSINEAEAAAARAKAARELAAAEEKAGRNEFAIQAAHNIQGITASLIAGEHSAKSFGVAMVDSLRRIAAEILAQQILTALFGSFTGSGGFMGAFASAVVGKKADGGSYSSGKPRIVGERGPELEIPANSGVIIPNHQMGGMGSAMFAPGAIQIDARGALDPSGITRAGVMLERRILGAVAERQTRGITRGSNG